MLPRWTDRTGRVFGGLAGLLASVGIVASGALVPGSARAKAPDWVEHAGRSARFPPSHFVTGYGMGEGADARESARAMAASDLASQISVRIQHELRDVSEDRDGTVRYEVAAVTRSTSDVRLRGLRYESWKKRGTVHALAVLEREPAAAARRGDRERARAELGGCLAAADRHERAGRVVDALRTWERCRRPLADALQHDAVARTLRPDPESDAAAERELLAATRTIDERLAAIRRVPAGSLSDAADALALQLARQGVGAGGRIAVAPFTYGTTDLSSAFGRQAALELERALASPELSPAAHSPAGDSLVVRGVYLERDDEIRLLATASDVHSGRLLGSAEIALPRGAAPRGVSLRPANFESALRDQRILAEGELVTGDLRVELWTQKGSRGVVLTEAEELSLYVRVNRPAWVRLVYVLENGVQVPIDQAWYLDGSKVNHVVEYPESFEVVPPFGAEHVHATAFTRRPTPLPVVARRIDGVEYEVVAEGMDGLVRHRGLRRKERAGVAESFVSVTTVPAGPPAGP